MAPAGLCPRRTADGDRDPASAWSKCRSLLAVPHAESGRVGGIWRRGLLRLLAQRDRYSSRRNAHCRRSGAGGYGIPDRVAGGNLHRGDTGRSSAGMALHRKVPVEDSALRNSDGGWAVETLACGCGYRHGRSGSCRAAATASARARCAWQRVIDCCTVMRSCATDHRSRASGRVISIPGSRRSSSPDSEIERV